ncbi:MAG: N-acylneuraminate-9-phosphate synthase [Lachnospiraceae bacterium]|nr:N-acylneuraminate-9-phosphate synthase [Lachnospiraceae bacterium]
MTMQKGKCYIIAEIGGNFTTFDEAKRLVDEAKGCGVDAVKLQTYKAETLSSKKAIFDMENTGIVSQYELFDQYSIGEELHKQVFDYARASGLDIFSSPSHKNDVALLERLGADAYKIGSDDAYNIPLLKQIASLGKPVFYATGMCTLDEVKESVQAMLQTGNKQIIILHAITAYPTHPEDVNLRAMQTLKGAFPELSVGYSDHTLGTTACICAAAMGAEVLEKHFTYDKHADGPDHMHSADPAEMKAIVDAVREFELMRGDGIKKPAKAEEGTRINNRKSIVMIKDVAKGAPITADAVDIMRPGYGIQPKYLEEVIGRIAACDLKRDDILTWEALA